MKKEFLLSCLILLFVLPLASALFMENKPIIIYQNRASDINYLRIDVNNANFLNGFSDLNFLHKWSNVIIVDTGGNGDYTTITGAVSVATSGTVIYVMPGNYSDVGQLPNGVSLVGIDREKVIIQKSSGTVITALGNNLINGLTIRSTADVPYGGVAVKFQGDNITLKNCRLLAHNDVLQDAVGVGTIYVEQNIFEDFHSDGMNLIYGGTYHFVNNFVNATPTMGGTIDAWILIKNGAIYLENNEVIIGYTATPMAMHYVLLAYPAAAQTLDIVSNGNRYKINSGAFATKAFVLDDTTTGTINMSSTGDAFTLNGASIVHFSTRSNGKSNVSYSGTQDLIVTGTDDVNYDSPTFVAFTSQNKIDMDYTDTPNNALMSGTVVAGGSMGTGAYNYQVTYVTALGESDTTSTRLTVTTTPGNNTVNLSGIPVSTDSRVTSKKIYRTSVGDSYWKTKYLATIPAADTTYPDSAADTVLDASQQCYFRANTTNSAITKDGAKAITLDDHLVTVGPNAGESVTIGGMHTYIGSSAGAKSTTGTENVAIGRYAGSKITTSSAVVAIGSYALGINGTTGVTGSTGIGWNALVYSTGAYNTATGYFVGTNMSAGTKNAFYGDNSAGIGRQQTMEYNSMFGSESGYLNTGSSNIFLGYKAGYAELGSNKFYISNAQANNLLYGDFSNRYLWIGGDTSIINPSTLGTEVLTNPNLTSGTSWTATNDCTLASDKATWLASAHTASTLTQASASFATAAIGNKWYRFSYVVSGQASGTTVTTPTATITTSFASEAINLVTKANGTYVVDFKSAASPSDFVITSTLPVDAQTFTMDSFSLKQILGGDLNVNRNLSVTNDVNIGTKTQWKADGNVSMTSPNGTIFNCGVTNGGVFQCS